MAVNLDAFEQKLIDIKYIIHSKDDNNNGSDKLSKNIWDFYLKNTQNFRLFKQKIRLKTNLSETLRKYIDEKVRNLKCVDFYISGSTANGFATIDSDIDLCFIVTDFYESKHFVKSQKLRILAQIEEILNLYDFRLKDSQLIEARVPILRYTDSRLGIQVEINVNNEIGIRNTRLLYCYSKLDWRVVPICIAIKRWAKYYQIIDSFSGAFSSYCIELMVIFYLQSCRQPILPCLQQTNPELFDSYTDVTAYKELPVLDQLAPFESRNTKSLAKLFVGFFRFYLFDFDFTKDVASVRLAKTLSKEHYMPARVDSNQWEYVCVEEPFSGDNVARTVYERSAYSKIIDGFKQMYNKSVEVKDILCDCD